MVSAVRLVWSALRLGCLTLCWVVVAGLVALSGFHLAHSEPRSAIIGAIAVTPWIYMLAWVTLSFGLFAHRRALAGVSLVLVGLQLWWVVPDFDPISHLQPAPPGSARFRLFDVNVAQSNRNLSEIAAEIRHDNPQAVTMQELTPVGWASLEASGVMRRFRYDLVKAQSGSFGMAMWSVYPLEGKDMWLAAGHPELRAWVELPGGRRFRLDVLHTTAPYLGPDEPAQWGYQMAAIRSELAGEPRPLVAVGDLNATWYDWHFQALLSLGLRDAAVVAGQGWRMTWPRDQEPVVPYLRIDHILFSKGVSLQSYRLGQGKGSDHHPLLVSIAVGRA
jgi:endonuclease/exonuclease/phosphatase (EEP) superfamily protein YafD